MKPVLHLIPVSIPDDLYRMLRDEIESQQGWQPSKDMIIAQALRAHFATEAADPEREAGTVAELREALAPFAHEDLSNRFIIALGDNSLNPVIFGRGKACLTLHNFRRARKAYEASK
jgi:hypothetical protein